MRGAARDPLAHNRSPAARARAATALVDGEPLPEAPTTAEWVPVRTIGERSTAKGCCLHDHLVSSVREHARRTIERSHARRWMYPSSKQRFVRVHVAKARHYALVEQGSLDRTPLPAGTHLETLTKELRVAHQHVGPEVGERGGHALAIHGINEHLPEGTRVDEAHASVVDLEDDLRVRLRTLAEDQPAAHAQVYDEGALPLDLDDEKLTSPREGHDGPIGELLEPVAGHSTLCSVSADEDSA